MPEVVGAAADVAAEQIGVRLPHFASAHGVASEDTIAKARRETLDLALDRFSHAALRTVWNVTIGPERLAALRRSRGIEQTLLCDEHTGTVRMTTSGHRVFAFGNFFHAATEMERAGCAAIVCTPRHRGGECVIDLKNPRRVRKVRQATTVRCRKFVASDSGQLPAG